MAAIAPPTTQEEAAPMVCADHPDEGRGFTIWPDFGSLCAAMKRSPAHALTFMSRELDTDSHLHAGERACFHGDILPSVLEQSFQHYVFTYVTCKRCSSNNTWLTCTRSAGYQFVQCVDCGAKTASPRLERGRRQPVGEGA